MNGWVYFGLDSHQVKQSNVPKMVLRYEQKKSGGREEGKGGGRKEGKLGVDEGTKKPHGKVNKLERKYKLS